MQKLYKLIIYSGFVAFAFLCAAAILGMAGVFKYELHQLCGILAFSFGCVHVGLIMYKNHKVKQQKRGKK